MNTRLTKISEIEDFFNKLLKDNGIRNIYFSALPSTNKSETFVVIDTGNQIRNMNAYSKGSVNIFLYSKTNGKALSELESKVINAIENSNDERFSINIGYQMSDYNFARELHARIIKVNLLI